MVKGILKMIVIILAPIYLLRIFIFKTNILRYNETTKINIQVIYFPYA